MLSIDIVDKIIPTGSGGFFPTDVPQTQVIIESVKSLALIYPYL